MRPSTRKLLLWQGVGLLCYLVGMLLVLVVAVGVYLAPPEGSIENLSAGHMPALLSGVALLVAGRAISWYGAGDAGLAGVGTLRDSGPDQSALEELGYHIPPESSADPNDDPLEDGVDVVVCGNCGTRNERGYDYCSNCSSELPE